jgi:DNA-binding PadR family transcriptional regulator
MHGMKHNRGDRRGGCARMHSHGDGHGLFGGRGGRFGGGMGHGGGRRGKRFAGEELRLMVLGLLESGPQHGYQLIRSFAEKSGEEYTPSPGVLYPLLTLLADMGLVEEVAGEGSSRRSFALSDTGLAELEANRAVIDATLERLAAMGAEAGWTDSGPVRRAMMNLRTAAIQRLKREGIEQETTFAIAAILDEAAQKIERL